MTEKLALQLALILHGIPDERDACIQRLTDNLLAQGLEKVHVVQRDGKPSLCPHYDPTRTALLQVRNMAQAASAELGARYQHELMRIDGMDCSTCATVIEHALGRLDGALEALVSYAAERMRLEYDTEQVSRKAIVQRLEAPGYRVLEPQPQGPLARRISRADRERRSWRAAAGGMASRHAPRRPCDVGGAFRRIDPHRRHYACAMPGRASLMRMLDIDVLMIVVAADVAALGQCG